MSDPSLPHLRIIRASSDEERESAWSDFLEENTRLIMHVARRAAVGEDDVMDRYAYVLDRLREDDFKRLRAFSLNGTGKFSTWLVVVVRRLCIDHQRRVFGRGPRASADRPESVADIARRNLAGLIASEIDPDELIQEVSEGAERGVLRRERAELLAEVLGELETTDQLLLTLRYVDEHSPDRVARMVGYPSRFAVNRRLKRLIRNLRVRLEERGLER